MSCRYVLGFVVAVAVWLSQVKLAVLIKLLEVMQVSEHRLRADNWRTNESRELLDETYESWKV